MQIEYILQIGAKLLQIGAAPVVTNRGISYYSIGANLWQIEQLLGIRVELLQIGASIMYWGNYYKSLQNTCVNFSHLRYRLTMHYMTYQGLHNSVICLAVFLLPYLPS